MTEYDSLSPPKPLSNHFQDLYSIIRSTVILVAIFSILWSLVSTVFLTEWSQSFTFNEDSRNLAIYSPFDWVEIKWSFSILMSMTTVIPISSYMIFRFAKPGLYPHEYKWLRTVLVINSFILPILIFIIWFWFIPDIANTVSSLSELDNVSPRYDVAEITKLAIGITWVTIVSAVLFNALTIIRFTNGEIGIYYWARSRLIIICLGLLILTLPSTFDGLRILISASIILFCDFLSKFIPLSSNDN
tara:strand:+ start:56834 stop:57568 length:735 start_codon:yes stop_codon:yes gene_type:complete